LSWSAAASLALVLLVGPLNMGNLDMGTALGYIKEAFPSLSGAALEGTMLASDDPPEERASAEPAERDPEDGRTKSQSTSNQNESSRHSPVNPEEQARAAGDHLRIMLSQRPRATQFIGVQRPDDRLPAATLDIPSPLENDSFQPLYSAQGFASHRSGWTIIVGSLRSLRGAQWLVGHYRDLGLRSGIIAVPAGGAWEYLVGVGQFSKREEAEQAARRLRGRELPFRTQADRLRWEYVTAAHRSSTSRAGSPFRALPSTERPRMKSLVSAVHPAWKISYCFPGPIFGPTRTPPDATVHWIASRQGPR